MQISENKKLYIPSVVFLMAVMVFALSPMSPAMAQETGDVDSSEHSSEDGKSYDGKDGKSCDKKNKDKSESRETSGNGA